MGPRAPSLPIRERRRGAACLLGALFAFAVCVAESAAQTVLPPDPGKTVGRPVPLDGLIDTNAGRLLFSVPSP